MGPSPKKRYTEEMVPYKSLRATAEVTARAFQLVKCVNMTLRYEYQGSILFVHCSGQVVCTDVHGATRSKMVFFYALLGRIVTGEIFSGVLSSSKIISDPEEHRDDYVESRSSPTLQIGLPLCSPGTAQVEMMEDDSKSPTVYLQKSDEKELEPVAGGAILPSPQGSLPDRSLHREDGDNITVAGASVSLEHPASSANARETPARASRHHEPTVDTDVNHKIKSALTTEIGCFEQQYGRIFKLLQEVQGPLEVQLHFVKFAIKEAARFERHNLIQFLDNILDKLMSDSTIRSNDLDLSK
ncbi:hypothetical protein STEG23_008793 [Scotinomys teguina]